MFKKITLGACTLLILLHTPTTFSSEDPIINTTITPFFEALKNGDVRIIETYVDGPLYSQVKVLLRENHEYPDFLRDYYTGAQVNVIRIEDLTEKSKDVNVEIHFPDNHVESSVLRLNEIAGGAWKITEQTMLTR